MVKRKRKEIRNENRMNEIQFLVALKVFCCLIRSEKGVAGSFKWCTVETSKKRSCEVLVWEGPSRN